MCRIKIQTQKGSNERLFDMDMQYAHFQGNLLCQATEWHLNTDKRSKMMKNKREKNNNLVLVEFYNASSHFFKDFWMCRICLLKVQNWWSIFVLGERTKCNWKISTKWTPRLCLWFFGTLTAQTKPWSGLTWSQPVLARPGCLQAGYSRICFWQKGSRKPSVHCFSKVFHSDKTMGYQV